MSLDKGDVLSRRRTQAIGPTGPSFYFPPPRCDMTDEKEKLLAAAISQIEKDHGKGAIMRLGSRDVLVPVSVIPSGCLSIDAALGVGGFPRGRVIGRYGRPADGLAGATDVAGVAQADWHRFEIADVPHLHQPDSREDWRDVRQS